MAKPVRVVMIVMTARTGLAFAILVSLFFFVLFMLFALLTFRYLRESRKEFDYTLSNGEPEVTVIKGGSALLLHDHESRNRPLSYAGFPENVFNTSETESFNF